MERFGRRRVERSQHAKESVVVMSKMLWDKPVDVSGILIFGPTDALHVLTTEFHARTDLRLQLARNMMKEALAGRLSPDEAREFFEAVMAESIHLLDEPDLPLAS